MRSLKFIYTIGWIAYFSGIGFSANINLETIREELVGDVGRTWIVAEIVTFKGVSKECESGEVYKFLPNSQVLITKCVEGHFVRSTANWHLTEEGELDTIIVFGSESYQISFGGPAGKRQMRFRAVASEKIEPTTDVYLTLEPAQQ